MIFNSAIERVAKSTQLKSLPAAQLQVKGEHWGSQVGNWVLAAGCWVLGIGSIFGHGGDVFAYPVLMRELGELG